jgi:hypothetical protein
LPDRVTHSRRSLQDRDGCTRCFLAVPSQDYLLVRFRRARLAACRRYSRPSGLGSTPHRGDFHPDATLTLGLGRSILFNHRPSKATAKCSRPTVFRVATPTHRSLRTHYVPSRLSPTRGRGVRAGPWPFPMYAGLSPAPFGWRPPSSSHRPACAHLSERYLAHADYSCRHGSSGDSTARGVTPDFIHPPFSPTELPLSRFVGSFVTHPFG